MVGSDAVQVIKDQLTRARESLGLQRREVADSLGVDEAEVVSWEEGRSQPTLELLWNLAELYQRSTDYFLRRVPAIADHLSFRLETRAAMRDLPPEVRKAVVRFDELCRAEAELEAAIGRPRVVRLVRAENDCSPAELASRERTRLAIGDRPVTALRKVLAKQGVRVFMFPVPEVPATELSGLSWWHQSYGPCILVNSRNTAGRRQFTLAHEYAHLLRDDSPTVCAFMLDIPDERFANEFAAAFLMPVSDVTVSHTQVVGPRGLVPTDQQLGILAGRYGVSLEAMGHRLEGLALIPAGTTASRIREWEERPTFYRARKGPKWRHQLGEEFVSLALAAHSEGHISLSKLAKYLGQDVRTTKEVVDESRPLR